MRIVLTLLSIFAATFVSSQDRNPFKLTMYGSFLHTETIPNALFFFDEIREYDSFELRRAMRNHKIDIVVLGSNGGSVWEGLNMAAIIHDNDIITYVPNLPDEMGCYSACAYMFFGGNTRKVDGLLAVHQTGAYGSEQDTEKQVTAETQQETQFTVSEIIGFLNEFDTPPWVFEKMFRSRDFYVFSASEKRELEANATAISSQDKNRINSFVTSLFEYLDAPVEKKHPAIELYAREPVYTAGKNVISFVIDTEGIDAVDPKLIEALPMPVTFAINPLQPSAVSVLRSLREMKQEAVILADLSTRMSAEDLDKAIRGLMDAFPETVGIMESRRGSLMSSQETRLSFVKVLRASGHGVLLDQGSGDHLVAEFADSGIPAVRVHSDLDGNDQNERTIRRFIDAAAVHAATETSEPIVMLARLRPATMSAILIWNLRNQSQKLAVVPLSQQFQLIAKTNPGNFVE